ncbi:MAG: hypothetical protein NWP64_02555, partial [Maribacter sp.]|nr:hypothetical protein [Maribacter sp.]
MANIDYEITAQLKVNIWNQYVDNISNSLYIKPSYNISEFLKLEGEWLHQYKVGDGGNSLDSLRYFNQNSSDILGLKIAFKSKAGLVSLSYNRILPSGQFISPREWGREDLFSFQKRERS